MDSLQRFLTFISKETIPSRRNPDLGPVPPRPKADKRPDPLAAYKISQQAKKKAENEQRTKRMVDIVSDKIGRTPSGGKRRPGDSSSEVPI